MKKNLFYACCFLISLSNYSQTADEKWNLGIHGGYEQYNGDLGRGWYATDQAAYGFGGLSVSRYLNKAFDLSLFTTRGELGHLAPRDFSKDLSTRYNFRISLSTVNLLLRYHLTSRESVLTPYLFAGGSLLIQDRLENKVSRRNRTADLGVPLGAGLHLHLGPVVTLQLQEMFMYTSADDIDYTVKGLNDMYLLHCVGLTFNLVKPAKKTEGSRAGKRIDKCPEMKTGPERIDGEGKSKSKSKKEPKNK